MGLRRPQVPSLTLSLTHTLHIRHTVQHDWTDCCSQRALRLVLDRAPCFLKQSKHYGCLCCMHDASGAGQSSICKGTGSVAHRAGYILWQGWMVSCKPPQQIVLRIESRIAVGAPLPTSIRRSRPHHRRSIHTGSCGYGYLDQKAGTGRLCISAVDISLASGLVIDVLLALMSLQVGTWPH